jgi:hypothetical protein
VSEPESSTNANGRSSRNFRTSLQSPIRFVSLEWREDWEFDHPTVLLEPIRRYAPTAISAGDMIEYEAINIAIAAEFGDDVPLSHPGDQKEFDWRGWTWEKLQDVAEQYLAGNKMDFGTGFVRVVEEYVVLREDPVDGVVPDFLDEKRKIVESS